MLGWKEVADALSNGDINAAFVLAPTAMNLFNAGVKIKLTLFTHKTGSILITNKKANIKNIQDFAGKVVIIPYQLSVHHMLLHKMLSEAVESGIDCFITGTADEPTWYEANEGGIHFMALGHSATEKIGPKALAAHLTSTFPIKAHFIDTNNPF